MYPGRNTRLNQVTSSSYLLMFNQVMGLQNSYRDFLCVHSEIQRYVLVSTRMAKDYDTACLLYAEAHPHQIHQYTMEDISARMRL